IMSAKILVIGDSGTDQLIIKNILTGYSVLFAYDKVEALDIIEVNTGVDLIILDFNMPGKNNFQILSALQSDERYKKLRTIILTKHDGPGNEIKALNLGAVDYISKSMHLESLRVRIKIHIELSRTQRLLEEKLYEYELKFNAVLQQAPMGIAISQSNKPPAIDSCNFVIMNPAFEKITGRTRKEINNIGWLQITHPEDVDIVLNNFMKLKAGKIRGYSIEGRLIKPDNSIIWVNAIVIHLIEIKQQRFGYICLIQDITKRKKAEQALLENERNKSLLLSNLQGMAYRHRFKGKWTMEFVSSGCFELTGYSPEHFLYGEDIYPYGLVSPEYTKPLQNEWGKILANKLPLRYEYEIITAGGERKWVLDIGQGIYNGKGEAEAFEGMIIDISDRKKAEDILKYNSEHDELTGLYNRGHLKILLESDLKTQSREKKALIGINLNAMYSLKIIHGFEYSQALVKRIAVKLEPYCDDRNVLFATSEYNLVFYKKSYKNKNELLNFCEAISDTLGSLPTVERIDVGIGVLEIDEDNNYDMGKLLRNLLITSEKALKLSSGGNYICFYDKKMKESIIRRETIQNELTQIAAGKDRDRLFLQYQPVLNLHSNSICGFEVLARLRSHSLGLVPPLEFIQIAEETRHINSIGDLIVLQVCDFINELKNIGYDTINVSINISAIQLLKRGFTKHLLGLINRKKVNPERIILELTESIFTSRFERINRILAGLNRYGIKCAIDDFGTGYSSFSRERELNVNYIKIDRFFIDKLLHPKTVETVTGDIISMAHKFGHFVVAEGVEHEKQLQYLKANGCDKIQGYLVSKPLDKDEAIEFLRDSKIQRDNPLVLLNKN
ncbi:MAG TPA: EAL domain-containing protein, partial [Clostridia bacterium]|nr:EAL domain-containing protein [Clostridia bacterium]